MIKRAPIFLSVHLAFNSWFNTRSSCSVRRDKSVKQRRQIREAAKNKFRFFWEIFLKCGWVGWLIPKQGPNPSKPPKITPKIAFFDPNFTFRFPKSHKNPGVGGWVNRFGKGFPKKNGFFLAASLTQDVSTRRELEGVHLDLNQWLQHLLMLR